MCFVAISSHKELRKLRYRQKWEWRNGGPAGPAQWRLVSSLYSQYIETDNPIVTLYSYQPDLDQTQLLAEYSNVLIQTS